MLCQFCKKREATIHFTNVVGSHVEKIHICTDCADEKGFEYLKKSNFEKGDLLAGLMNLAAQTGKRVQSNIQCPGCGRTYTAFRKTGKLGCSQCYEVFSEQLEQVLTSIHGHTRHVGKAPKRFTPRIDLSRRIIELQNELKKVIELEEYEKAAKLRDEINSLRDSAGEGK